MNRGFDYNGTVVSQSKPVKQLKTAKKVLMIDSADRDTTKYYTNGDFTVYLPRVYENVVSIRLMAAEFPPLVASSSPGAVTHYYVNGQNYQNVYRTTGNSINDAKVVSGDFRYYFLIDIEGLNKTDECAVGANRSSLPDGFFAKIPAVLNGSFIEYNDHSSQENISKFSPAIGKLDRLHIRTRLHSQQKDGFIYWTSGGEVAGTSTTGVVTTANFCLSLEIEYLENSFDDFSSFETRVSDRA
jgi:hypothetical protein